LVLTFSTVFADYPSSTKSSTLTYPVTNDCASVVITSGTVFENGVATTQVTFNNGDDAVTLTYEAFTSSPSYCPLVYTVHMISTSDSSEVTWNREDNPASYTPAIDYTQNDSEFSAQASSNEYLTISRPANGADGTVTLTQPSDLEAFVGSFNIEIRAHH